MAADRPPPSRTASAIISVEARSARLETVRAVMVRPSSTGRPAAIMVDRVRAIRAPCRSRASRPTTGRRSSRRSTARRKPGLLIPATKPPIPPANSKAISQPQFRIRSDTPITARVSRGRVWFMLSNWSTTLGTTKIIKAVTTPSATRARTAG
ncbi:hypothetical protein D3C86_1423030 [compost metagenome]